MMKSLAVSAIVLAAAVGSADAATMLFSDDFESDAQVLNAALNNWTVTSGSVDVIGSPGSYPWYPTNNVDMNGSTGKAGRIDTATLAVKKGHSYTLSFDYGNNKNSNGNEFLSFGIGGWLSTLNINGYVGSLVNASYTFKALADNTTLFFADTGNTDYDNGGPVIDNVALAAVPLPAAAPMFFFALAGFAMLGRRRRRD